MALTLGAYTQNPCSKLELARELHCIPPPSLSHIGKEIPNSFLQNHWHYFQPMTFFSVLSHTGKEIPNFFLISTALALPPANDIFLIFFMLCQIG
jgi:hypothetical protein